MKLHPKFLQACAPKLHMFRGEWLTATQIAESTGVKLRTVHRRIRCGLPIDDPPRFGPEPRRILFRGEELTIAQIQERTGLSRSQVSKRTCGSRFFEKHELASQLSVSPGNRRMIFFRGKTLSVADWSRETGLPRHMIDYRLGRGWSVERALTTPVRVPIVIILRRNSEAKPIRQWARESGVNLATLTDRLEHGWPPCVAAFVPPYASWGRGHWSPYRPRPTDGG